MRFFPTIWKVVQLEHVCISLGETEESDWIRGIFKKPHPRLRIIPNKVIGVELLKLSEYIDGNTYLATVGGKNSAAYYARKATRAGYKVEQFDPNYFIDAMYEINTSKQERQGQPMTIGYLEKICSYRNDEKHPNFGVFAGDGVLCGYISLYCFGELVLINRILGHGDHLDKGIMYLLGTEVVKTVIDCNLGTWLMYDTYFGASEGLKLFKKRLGFKPYWAEWK